MNGTLINEIRPAITEKKLESRRFNNISTVWNFQAIKLLTQGRENTLMNLFLLHKCNVSDESIVGIKQLVVTEKYEFEDRDKLKKT